MTKNDTKRLVLLDVHAIIHRAFHAVPPLTSSKGIPTGALYGLLNMFLKMVQDINPDYIIACYDLPQPTFRHESYDGYKKGRKQTEDTLKVQIEESRNIFEALSIPTYQIAGFEADDMLGTIVEQLKTEKDISVVIVSGDMDTLQLVRSDEVVVYTMKKGVHETVVYNEQAVHDRFGFGPEHIPDYKGLRGDASDNIIGIPGIGEKTATELIVQFGSIEETYKKLHDNQQEFLDKKIKPRIIELLLQHEADAIFSKTLATIRHDAPLDFILPEKRFSENYTPEKIIRLTREYEFRTLTPKFEQLFHKAVKEESIEDFDSITDNDSFLFLKASVGLWMLNSDMVKPSREEIFQETETDELPFPL